jgi:hypothetical protein
LKPRINPISLHYHLWRIRRSIDLDKFQSLREKYKGTGWGENRRWNLQKRLQIDLKHASRLQLDHGPALKILDIGTGFGYFPYICRYFGHDPLGVDVMVPANRDVVQLLTVPWRECRVEAFHKLPDFDRKFDLITAILIFFNNPRSANTWGVDEWSFFLKDLAENQLTEAGRIYLVLNTDMTGDYYKRNLFDFFQASGAEIDNNMIYYRQPKTIIESEVSDKIRP